ncbi:hypothetical protein IFT54_05480 [Sphingomonas sp. CFBP 13714]|uniref:hypothetical protein n=1 Tax=Sphingomonas sp. CFBP 13714 TaxID=2775308 RepID=UPI00177AF07D|nr:hypothetical protein [Sphingomonas sp. CFBP 13714]MBD8699266.1 hypothetical protein [Sphingomonas sp. CFBP 13714]
MIVAMALALSSSGIFLRTEVEGWTVSKATTSCRAEKRMSDYKKISILKGEDASATFFLTASEYGGEYFGERKVTEPNNIFEVYLKKGVTRQLFSASQKAEAMAFEGRVSIMTTFDFNKLVSNVGDKESILFRRDDSNYASFLLDGLPSALSLLDKCSRLLPRRRG